MQRMKIAVIGTGKTGGEVLRILDEEQVVGPFDSTNAATVDKLELADAAIIFVPGSAVEEIMAPVMESGIAAVWGSTGYEWNDEQLDQQLKQRGIKWMRASNFSLGMNIIRRCLQLIGKGAGILDEPEFSIHEIHHADKQDAPSGTAISWKQWLDKEAGITSERKGDIKGIHQLLVKTKFESIKLEHEAHDRAVFAEGAVWAVQQLVNSSIEPGFYTMETLFDQKIK